MERSYLTPSEMLEFQKFYGFTSAEVDEFLSQGIDPLHWFRSELSLSDNMSGLMSLTSDTNKALLAIQHADETKRTFEKQECNRVAFQACVYLSGDDLGIKTPIVFDTGCSFSLTPFLEDFVGELEAADIDEMQGINNSIAVKGVGWVEWTIRDVFGNTCVVRTRAYYVPESHMRLFSPQKYCKENGRGPYGYFDYEKLEFTTVEGVKLTFPWSSDGNLPIMYLDNSALHVGVPRDMEVYLQSEKLLEELQSILSSDNYNLDNPTKELSLIHCRAAHAGCGWLQELMHKRKGHIGSSSNERIIPTKYATCKTTKPPKCAACLMAKQHRRGPGSQRVINRPEYDMAIRRDAREAGSDVSMDQWIVSTLGRLPHTKGKEQDKDRYHGGTIYFDHHSAYIHLEPQVSLAIGETLEGKHRFEAFAARHGVKLRNFRTDNHPFNSKEFLEDLDLQDQTITFSGVGAHHQAGVAERAIQTVTHWARAMMMEQLLRWPDEFDPANWAFALEHAVYVWNHMPRARNGLSPIELFTGTKTPSYDPALTNLRIWGCPAWTLDPKLQDGHKLPKFTARSRCGMYLGSSPKHSDSIGRILNLETGHVSPQFHVVYDEMFSTVNGSISPDVVLDEDLWQGLFEFQGYADYLDPEDRKNPAVMERVQDMYDSFSSRTPVPEGDGTFSPIEPPDELDYGTSIPEEPDDEPRYVTRSGRQVKKGKHKNDPLYAATISTTPARTSDKTNPHLSHQYLAGGIGQRKVKCKELNNAALHGLDWNPSSFLTGSSVDTKRVLLRLLRNFDEGSWDPMALGAKSNSVDTFTWAEAMNGPNAEGFTKAATIEYETLKKMEVWDVVTRQPWMHVLPGTWTFRVKRFTDGAIRKLKARFCARGDRQIQGVDYFDTWAPVVSWNTIRLLLVLSAVLDLATRQVDYTAAFVHAEIDKPPNWNSMTPQERDRWGIYLEMPKGFQEHGKVLKLKKSLYGLCQAPRLWGEHLKKNLEKAGFRQAVEVDACLFISDKVICVTYVDDTLFFARDMADIDAAIQALKDQDMTLEVEDSVAGFLGVQVSRDEKTGKVQMTQTGLIDRIIEALGCEDLPPADTPADTVLGKDEFGDPAACTFNYASVQGMIWYLERHSRPDISFAASQTARFAFNPKRSHELALIRIGQYLKKTRTKGLIYEPFDSKHFQMDCHVDSDFMGLYGKEQRSDPDNVKSRTGYVISINGCPITWASRLQDSISLSTMMAEYYALSTAMREVIPLRDLVKVVAKASGLEEDCATDFKVIVWEDNDGCWTLANMDPGQHTPRSKFYDCKVHWFRSHLKDGTDRIRVEKIDTKEQLADIFTKPLPKAVFEYLRKKMMGW